MTVSVCTNVLVTPDLSQIYKEKYFNRPLPMVRVDDPPLPSLLLLSLLLLSLVALLLLGALFLGTLVGRLFFMVLLIRSLLIPAIWTAYR